MGGDDPLTVSVEGEARFVNSVGQVKQQGVRLGTGNLLDRTREGAEQARFDIIMTSLAVDLDNPDSAAHGSFAKGGHTRPIPEGIAIESFSSMDVNRPSRGVTGREGQGTSGVSHERPSPYRMITQFRVISTRYDVVNIVAFPESPSSRANKDSMVEVTNIGAASGAASVVDDASLEEAMRSPYPVSGHRLEH